MDLGKKIEALAFALVWLLFTLFLIVIVPFWEGKVALILWLICILVGVYRIIRLAEKIEVRN